MKIRFTLTVLIILVTASLVLSSCSEQGTGGDETGTLAIQISQGGQQAKLNTVRDSVVISAIEIAFGNISFIAHDSKSIVFRDSEPTAIELLTDSEVILGYADVPATTLHQMSFTIATVDESDSIYTEYVNLQDASIYCQGYVDSAQNSFEWKFDKQIVINQQFASLSIQGGDTVVIDIRFDWRSWFRNDAEWFDPVENSFSTSDKTKIESNIRSSIDIVY